MMCPEPENPSKLLSSIQDDNHRLTASIQYEGGARISEAALIKNGQLIGLEKDRITGEVKGKGHPGKQRDL